MSISKKWAIAVLGLVSFGTVFVVLVNCVVDTYGILRTDFTRQFQEPNENFIKMKYLLNNRGKYDSFLFGSSRVSHTNIKNIKNGTYYSIGYSEGLPKEHLGNIKLLLRSNVRIKNIMLGLDDFSYRVDPEKHRQDLMRQPHPLVSGKRFLTFYSEYYVKMKKFIPSLCSYIMHNYRNKRSPLMEKFSYDFYDSGRPLCRTCDDDIERDPAKHRSSSIFDEPTHYEGDNMAGALESIRELVDIAKNNNINLTIFINPLHHVTYLDTDMEQFFAFKKELARISRYYDFSGLNTITTDNYYYYETSHYRTKVGDMMLNRMFGYPPVDVPADFGALVTEQNIDAHLRNLSRQLTRRRHDVASNIPQKNSPEHKGDPWN